MKRLAFLLLFLPLLLTGQNVGIGIATPTEKLHVAGNLRFDRALMPNGNAGTSGQVLVSQGAATAPAWQTPAWAGICNTATTNYVQKWTGAELCNTIIFDNGTRVGISTATPASKFEVVDGGLSFRVGGNLMSLRKDAGTGNRYPYFEIRNGSGVRAFYLGWGIQGNYVDFMLENGNDLAIRGGNVAIGHNAPLSKLHVEETTFEAGIPGSYYPAIYGHQTYASSSSVGVYGRVDPTSNVNAKGVVGYCKPADYYGYGGLFEGGYRGVQGQVFPTGSGFYYGVYGYVSGGSGTNYALRGYAYGTGTKYGVYSYASGTGTNYGVRAYATGGTDYALYAAVPSTYTAGTDWGAHIYGPIRVQFKNRTYAMIGTNKAITFGKNSESYSGDGNTYTLGGYFTIVDYVADFDRDSSRGTAVGVGSIEYFIDGEASLFVNYSFSPITDGSRSLGLSAHRWSSVWAANGTIQTSDARLKRNIKSVGYGLDEILKINPIQWKWKPNENDPYYDDNVYIGLSAQELLNVVPEAVVTEEWICTGENPLTYEKKPVEHYGVRYSSLIPVLINAVKELNQKLEEANKRIEYLESKVNK